MKSSYPLGGCPNLGLRIDIRHHESFRRILKQDTTSRHNFAAFDWPIKASDAVH